RLGSGPQRNCLCHCWRSHRPAVTRISGRSCGGITERSPARARRYFGVIARRYFRLIIGIVDQHDVVIIVIAVVIVTVVVIIEIQRRAFVKRLAQRLVISLISIGEDVIGALNYGIIVFALGGLQGAQMSFKCGDEAIERGAWVYGHISTLARYDMK